MRCHMINSSLIDEPSVQLLTPKQFWRAFVGALKGEETALSPFVRPGRDRPPAAEWAVTRARIFARDDYTCTYCWKRGVKLQCDHIVPVARGGSHDDNNLTTACEPCNRSKAAKLLSEWVQCPPLG